METFGGSAITGGGGKPGISPVIQGDDTRSLTFRFGVMGDVRRNDEGGGGNPFGVPP